MRLFLACCRAFFVRSCDAVLHFSIPVLIPAALLSDFQFFAIPAAAAFSSTPLQRIAFPSSFLARSRSLSVLCSKLLIHFSRSCGEILAPYCRITSTFSLVCRAFVKSSISRAYLQNRFFRAFPVAWVGKGWREGRYFAALILCKHRNAASA